MTDHVTGGTVDTCFVERSKVRGIIIQSDADNESTSAILRDIDALPILTAEDFRDRAQTMQWQPRETAPKTGKPFLAFFPDGDFTPETGIDVIWWEPSEERFLIGGSPIIWKFTHWTPLPTAPAIPSTLLGTEPSAPASEDRTDGR